MRKVLLALLSFAAFPFALWAQQLTYSLSQTVIVVEVDAVREVTYAGPYAAYAHEFLGLVVPLQDEYATVVKSIRATARVEADLSARSMTVPSKASSDLLALSSLGLVSFGSRAEAESASWNLAPILPGADYSGKGLTQPYTTVQKTVYKEVRTDTSFVRVPLQQDVKAAKSLEQKAREAADMVLRARQEKFKITVGDTDATYSGEALGAAITELTRLENEYLSLFTGCTVRVPVSRTFEVIPVQGTESYDVFRISDTEGILAADAKEGKPYYMDVIPAAVAEVEGEGAAKSAKGSVAIRYRVPSVCAVTLGTGTSPLLQMRVPVYQFGQESEYIVK